MEELWGSDQAKDRCWSEILIFEHRLSLVASALWQMALGKWFNDQVKLSFEAKPVR
jgi:hypothetical protein